MYYLWILARETPRTYERTFWSQIFICTVSVFSPWQLAPELGVSKKNPRAQCDCNVNSLRVILYNRVIDHKIPVFYTKEEKKKQAHINLLHPVCWAFVKKIENQTQNVGRQWTTLLVSGGGLLVLGNVSHCSREVLLHNYTHRVHLY